MFVLVFYIFWLCRIGDDDVLINLKALFTAMINPDIYNCVSIFISNPSSFLISTMYLIHFILNFQIHITCLSKCSNQIVFSGLSFYMEHNGFHKYVFMISSHICRKWNSFNQWIWHITTVMINFFFNLVMLDYCSLYASLTVQKRVKDLHRVLTIRSGLTPLDDFVSLENIYHKLSSQSSIFNSTSLHLRCKC